MIILKETEAEQLINLTFLKGQASKLVVTDNETLEVFEYNVSFTPNKYYSSVYLAMPELKENHTYRLDAYMNTILICREQIFVTNQEIEDYTINKNVYVEHSTNNEFIIYE